MCLSKCKHQTLNATFWFHGVCVCSMQCPCPWWACDLWEGVNPIYEKRQIRPLLFRTILCVLCLFHMILHLHVCLWDFAAILLEEHSSVMDRGALQDYCISCIDASPWCPQLMSILATQLALSVPWFKKITIIIIICYNVYSSNTQKHSKIKHKYTSMGRFLWKISFFNNSTSIFFFL